MKRSFLVITLTSLLMFSLLLAAGTLNLFTVLAILGGPETALLAVVGVVASLALDLGLIAVFVAIIAPSLATDMINRYLDATRKKNA